MLPTQDSDHPLDKIRFGLMVAIGGADPKETLKVITEQEEIVDRELREVPQRASALGQEFLDQSAETRRELQVVLEEYRSWLSQASAALKTEDTATTMALHEESQDLLPKLTTALENYSKVYSSAGPFQGSPANTLWRIATSIQDSSLAEQSWSEYCEYYQSELSKKLETLVSLDVPGRTALVEGYSASLKVVHQLGQQGLKPADAARPLLEEFDRHYTPSELLETVMSAALKKNQTRIPATNVLLEVLGSSRKHLPQTMVFSVLDDYNETVEGYLETFERAVARPTHSDLIREEIPRTLDTIDGHFMLIEDLNDLIEEGESLEVMLSKIEESANKLIESREVYEVAAQHQSFLACPSCSRSNPPENRACEACGEPLPQADKTGRRRSSTFSLMSGPITEETQKLEMTEYVANLFRACDDMNDGKIGVDEYTQELQKAATALTDFVEEYENLVAMALDESLFSPEEWENWRNHHLPYLEDMAISYYAGIEDMQKGLVSMETYLTEPDEAHLVEGIRLYWQGVQAVHHGRLGIQAHSKLLDDLLKETQGKA